MGQIKNIKLHIVTDIKLTPIHPSTSHPPTHAFTQAHPNHTSSKHMEQVRAYWNDTLAVLRQATHTTWTLYETHVEPDWQLQGSCVLFVVFLVLCLCVKMQWNLYGATIMGGGVDGIDLTSNVNTTFDTFPDEDPLTFTKKKTN